MTKPVLELPSDIYRKAEMTEKLQQEVKEREEAFVRRIAQLEAQLKARDE